MKVHLIEYIVTPGAAPPYYPDYYEKPVKSPMPEVLPPGSPVYVTEIKTIKYRYDGTERLCGLYNHRYVADYEGEPPDDEDVEECEDSSVDGELEDKGTAEEILKTEKIIKEKIEQLTLLGNHLRNLYRSSTQHLNDPTPKTRIHKSFEEMLEEQEEQND